LSFIYLVSQMDRVALGRGLANGTLMRVAGWSRVNLQLVLSSVCKTAKKSNQVLQLNNLLAKQIKTPADLQQISALERKLAAKSGQLPSKPQRPRVQPRVVQGGSSVTYAPAKNRRPPIDPRQLIMANLGTTDDGRKWALTAVDPGGCAIASLMGLPDMLSSNVVTPFIKDDVKITYDSTMFSTPPAAPGGTYSIHIVSPGIPEVLFMYRIRDDLSNTWSRWRVRRMPNHPITASAQGATAVTLGTDGYNTVRIIAKGITGTMDAPQLADQGYIVAGQVECETFHGFLTEFSGPSSATNLTLQGSSHQTGNSVLFESIFVPTDSDQIIASCPLAHEGAAREGFYMPHKWDEPFTALAFKPTGGGRSFDNGTVFGGAHEYHPESAMTVTLFDGTTPSPDTFTDDSRYGTTSVPAIPSNMPPANQMHPGISGCCGIITGNVFILNIANPAGAGVTGGGASFRIKTHMFIEGQLSFGHPVLTPFAHGSARLDNKAMEMVANISQVALDAYPASYNSLGTILKSIWEGIKSVAKPILNVASMIPGVAPYAIAGNAVISAGETLENSLK
jgi:hypothetical protein